VCVCGEGGGAVQPVICILKCMASVKFYIIYKEKGKILKCLHVKVSTYLMPE